jgi:hypothetical protein
MQEERRRDGKGRRRVIGRKRGIGATGNQEMGHTAVIGAHPVNEEKDKLIKGEANKERESSRDKGVASVRPFGSPPPLSSDGKHQKRDTDGGNPDHQKIDDRTAFRRSVDCVCYCGVEFIHRLFPGLGL